MLLSRTFEPPDFFVVTVGGVVTSRDHVAIVGWVRDQVRRTGPVKLLILLEGFAGWTPVSVDQASWLRDGDEVSRIAIVGAGSWKTRVLTMLGQPLRRIPIACFDTEPAARQWLAAVGQASAGTRST